MNVVINDFEATPAQASAEHASAGTSESKPKKLTPRDLRQVQRTLASRALRVRAY